MLIHDCLIERVAKGLPTFNHAPLWFTHALHSGQQYSLLERGSATQQQLMYVWLLAGLLS